MRLIPDQADTIRQHIRSCMGLSARIWLFGSRADDSRRGGRDLPIYRIAKQSGVPL